MKWASWRMMPVVIFIALALFLWKGLSLDPHRLDAMQVGQHLPDFELKSVLDVNEAPFNTQLFQGHLSLLIVWASWCDVCQEEQLFLFDLAQQGWSLFGLNYKDDPASAKRWLKEWGNPYKSIGQDPKGKLALDLGVYGAPEAFLIDTKGVIRYRYPGALMSKVWQDEFKPRIALLKDKS